MTYGCDVSFTCPSCHKEVRTFTSAPEPDWTDGSSYEFGEVEIECPTPDCAEVLRAKIENFGGYCRFEVEEYPDVKIPETAAYDPDDEEPLVENATDVFIATHSEVMLLLDKNGSDYGGDLINRMSLVQLVSALEAFLSDTLILKVRDDRDALARLLNDEKSLKPEKYPLAQIAADKNFVWNKVRSQLGDISFHHLTRVEHIYKTVFEFDLLPDVEAKFDILKAIQLRHHCVHRNGKDTDGNRLNGISAAYVRRVGKLFQDLVLHVARGGAAGWDVDMDDALPF